MKKLQVRRHGLLLLGVVALAATCITASPAPRLQKWKAAAALATIQILNGVQTVAQ